jgi:hypothetical protein
MAFTTFTIEKRKSKRWGFLYLLTFLMFLVVDVVAGYQAILGDELFFASKVFLTMFIFSCWLLVDLWMTSEFD